MLCGMRKDALGVRKSAWEDGEYFGRGTILMNGGKVSFALII